MKNGITKAECKAFKKEAKKEENLKKRLRKKLGMTENELKLAFRAMSSNL
jgi:hypothetical protein